MFPKQHTRIEIALWIVVYILWRTQCHSYDCYNGRKRARMPEKPGEELSAEWCLLIMAAYPSVAWPDDRTTMKPWATIEGDPPHRDPDMLGYLRERAARVIEHFPCGVTFIPVCGGCRKELKDCHGTCKFRP